MGLMYKKLCKSLSWGVIFFSININIDNLNTKILPYIGDACYSFTRMVVITLVGNHIFKKNKLY